jgi:NAD(P)-dependent dehydrogenase (short-subunit alcohol dehydrogenase family)
MDTPAVTAAAEQPLALASRRAMDFDLAGRVAVVAGASGALGGALVRRLAGGGARVAALDRRPERLAAMLAVELGETGRWSVLGADYADPASVERAFDEIVARHGGLDLLFNAAGAFGAAPSVEETSPELWTKMWEANFRPTLEASKAAVARMKRGGRGAIVNVGSRGALRGDAGVAAYSIAKAAVVRLTESLADEGRRHGVRVNCVLPGTIDTPANRAAMPGADPSRWVELDALADAMLFLASPAARAITGVALPVFGVG